MASPQDAVMDDGQDQNHQPFTVEENIQQLIDIDKCIVQLMTHTATALNGLTISSTSTNLSPSAEVSKPPLDPVAQKESFRSATDSFLTTLHTIDVRMKRQVLALEEASIVNLSTQERQDTSGPTKASLKPNGVGAIGNIDVGWLNSRGTRVERDMEAELWTKIRELLQKNGDSFGSGI
ncbi:Fc.00g075530.m01.CDS01 [Cosmosporella sp. VM-42]